VAFTGGSLLEAGFLGEGDSPGIRPASPRAPKTRASSSPTSEDLSEIHLLS